MESVEKSVADMSLEETLPKAVEAKATAPPIFAGNIKRLDLQMERLRCQMRGLEQEIQEIQALQQQYGPETTFYAIEKKFGHNTTFLSGCFSTQEKAQAYLDGNLSSNGVIGVKGPLPITSFDVSSIKALDQPPGIYTLHQTYDRVEDRILR